MSLTAPCSRQGKSLIEYPTHHSLTNRPFAANLPSFETVLTARLASELSSPILNYRTPTSRPPCANQDPPASLSSEPPNSHVRHHPTRPGPLCSQSRAVPSRPWSFPNSRPFVRACTALSSAVPPSHHPALFPPSIVPSGVSLGFWGLLGEWLGRGFGGFRDGWCGCAYVDAWGICMPPYPTLYANSPTPSVPPARPTDSFIPQRRF